MFWVIIAVLIVGWVLGVFVFGLGTLLHVLLIVALCALIYRLIRGAEAKASEVS